MRPLRRPSAFLGEYLVFHAIIRAARCRNVDMSGLKRFVLGLPRVAHDNVPAEIVSRKG